MGTVPAGSYRLELVRSRPGQLTVSQRGRPESAVEVAVPDGKLIVRLEVESSNDDFSAEFDRESSL